MGYHDDSTNEQSAVITLANSRYRDENAESQVTDRESAIRAQAAILASSIWNDDATLASFAHAAHDVMVNYAPKPGTRYLELLHDVQNGSGGYEAVLELVHVMLENLLGNMAGDGAVGLFASLIVSTLGLEPLPPELKPEAPVDEPNDTAPLPEDNDRVILIDLDKIVSEIDVISACRPVAAEAGFCLLAYNPENMESLGRDIRRLNPSPREIESIVTDISGRGRSRGYRDNDRGEERGRHRGRDQRVMTPSLRSANELVLSGDQFAEIVRMATGDDRRPRDGINPLEEGRVCIVIGLDENQVTNYGIRLNTAKETNRD